MRILLDGTTFERPAHGVARVTLGLYRACREIDPTIEVRAVHRRELACQMPEWIGVVRTRIRGSARTWRSLVLPAHSLMSRTDWVHVPGWGTVPRMPFRRVVLTIHDVFAVARPGFGSAEVVEAYRCELQRNIDRSDVIITVSESTKRDILRHLDVRSEPVVISPGCDFELDADPDREPNDYFLAVRVYVPNKGLEALLDAFLGLHRDNRIRGKLLIAGAPKFVSDEADRLLDEGRRLGVVEELGWVPDDRLKELYKHAKALVYPSSYEGFGLPPLEAMTLGCPVITTRAASIPEVCGNAALYIDPASPTELAEALPRLETDRALRRELIEKGRAQSGKFSWRASAERYLDVLRLQTNRAPKSLES